MAIFNSYVSLPEGKSTTVALPFPFPPAALTPRRGLPSHQQSGGGGAAERHHRLASAHRGAHSSGDGSGDDEAAERHDAWQKCLGKWRTWDDVVEIG